MGQTWWRGSDAVTLGVQNLLKREEFVARMGQTWWRGSDATLQGVVNMLKREEFVKRMAQLWRGSDETLQDVKYTITHSLPIITFTLQDDK